MKMTPDDPCTPILDHLGEGFDLTVAYRWRRELSAGMLYKSQYHRIGPNGIGFHKSRALAAFKPANAQKVLSISASPLRRKI
jgi:hypothetical protein